MATSFDAALARIIDHTLLRPDAVEAEIAELCATARRYAFRTVCVQPVFVAQAARALAGTGVGVSAVVAFPHGASVTEIKVAEARRARADGATELDLVANLGWIRAGQLAAVKDEVAAVVAAAAGAPVKVILETALLAGDDGRKVEAARAAVAGGAAFVKTSTGFGPGGATASDVSLLRLALGPSVGIKASGGVRTRAEALALVAAGADRIGASASVDLVTTD